MGKLTRGINKEFAAVFRDTAVYRLLLDHPHELFLGVRNGYINIYYHSASICKGRVARGVFTVEIAKRYLDSHAPEGYVAITPDMLAQKYSTIKNNIDTFYSNDEKTAQQRLVNNNNANPGSSWLCIDIEYKKQRSSSAETDPGRFDIIAVTRKRPHRVAFIELKYGTKAMGGSSGILKHSQDYIRFIKDMEFNNHLLPEIVEMTGSYRMIYPDYPLGDVSIDDYLKTPNFYFITLDNIDDRARDTMRRYMRNDVRGSSTRNVMDVLGVDITTANHENFIPTLLFSEGDGTNITDIIEDKNYSIGL